MPPLWILRRLANVSPFFNSLSNRLRITNYCLRFVSSSLLKFTYQNQVNISNHNEKKVMTTKYLAKFQSPTAVSWPKIIQPEWISNLICNLWLYTLIPKIKSISQISEKKWWQLNIWPNFKVHYRAITRPKSLDRTEM